MRLFKILCLILCVTLITSCGWFKKDKNKTTQTVEQMYNEGSAKLEEGSYKTAIEKFEELETTYPYSEWATKAQIMSAYSSFKNEDYDTALLTLERFIKLHPGNKDIDYAYYLRALSFYEQISDVTKDQSYSSYAKSALQEVIARFPTSKYALDARLKLDLVNDHLAGKELTVGRFYLKKGDYSGAINRFKKVIENYDTTSHVPEALHRLVESYMSLGVREEAIKYASVLGYNFPGSKWYERSYVLLEGKKPVANEDKTGKWYDLGGWKGLTFKKEKAEKTEKFEEKGEPLTEVKIKELPSGNDIAPPSDYEKTEEPNKTGLLKKTKGWFTNMHLPFSGKKPVE